MRGSLTVVVIAIGLLLSRRGAAQTEQQLPDQYLAVKLGIGIAGSVSASSDAQTLRPTDERDTIVLTALDGSSDLKSGAIAAEVDYIFSAHEYFGVGGLLGFHTWRSTAAEGTGEGTSLGFQVGFILQPRVPLSRNFELYVSLPISLTLSLLNEYKAWAEVTHPRLDAGANGALQGVAEDADPTYGYGIGALIGARYAISGQFGLLLEFGYQRFGFTHDVAFRVSDALDNMGSGTNIALHTATSQFRLNAGVFF
jgi:hypothetical protein